MADYSTLEGLINQTVNLEDEIKFLSDYLMSEWPDDPNWVLGESACHMAVAIMRREARKIKEANETFRWLGEGYDA